MKRTVIGLLVAPLAPTLILLPAGGISALLMSYVLTAVFGIPSVLILRTMKRESHLSYCLLGFLLGAAYLFLVSGFQVDPVEAIPGALLLGVLGCITALCFSLIQGNEKKSNKGTGK